MPGLFTIGYERASIADFVETLIGAGVDCLVDVRDVPWSRRPEYAKGDLIEVLSAAGIDYLHFKSLGNPLAGRDAARAGESDTYRRIYTAHLETPTAERALAEVSDLAARKAACLMCYERDPERCHRLMITDTLLARHDVAATHLYPTLKDGQLSLL